MPNGESRNTNESGNVVPIRRRPSKKFLAGCASLLLLLGAGGGAAATLAIEHATRSSGQNKLTMQDIHAAARNLGQECLDSTASGITKQSGTKKDRTVARIFTGGTACRVVVHNGRISEVSIRQPAILSHNSGTTTYDLRYRDTEQTAVGGAYSWEFYEATQPGAGNIAGVAIEGFGFSSGGDQTWVAGAQKNQLSPDGAVDSSVPFSVSGIGEAAGKILYDKVFTGMREALSQAG